MTEYEISINGLTRKLSLKKDAQRPDVLHVELDSGKEVKIVVKKRVPDFFIVSVDDSLLEIRSNRGTNDFVNFEINGLQVFAEFGSTQKLDKRKSQTSEVATVGKIVVSNFPAKVVKITREKNLKENDTLMIVEAMKMEAHIKAPTDCTVEEVYAKEGEMVEKGTKLAKLSFPPTGSG